MSTSTKLTIAFLSISLLVGCGTTNQVQKQESPDTATKATETSTNKDMVPAPSTPTAASNLKVTLPDGWTRVEGSVLENQYMKNTASFIAKTEDFGTTDLDEVTDKALAIFQKTFKGVATQGAVEKLTVDGKDARKLVFTSDFGGMTMKFMYVYVLVGNDTYALTFGDLVSTYDNQSSDYQAILDQIKF